MEPAPPAEPLLHDPLLPEPLRPDPLHLAPLLNRPSLAIALSPGQEPLTWAARNRAGQVASEWPYALNLLERQFDLSPVVSDALNSRRLAQVWLESYTRRIWAGPRRAKAFDADYSFSWDEHMVLRSLALVDAQRYVSGLIWVSDDVLTGKNRLQRALLRSVLRQLDGIFFSSSAQLDITRKWLGNAGVRLEWIPMGIDPDFYPLYDYPASPFVFSMGSDKHRDPAALGRALGLVLDQRPDVEILVQTNRPEAFPRGVETVARLTGDDIRRNYARASVVAVATLPNVHVSGITVGLEGMSSGRPVVMTANPGLEDYVREGETGFLIRQGDSEGFASRILEILSDRARGERMGLAARRSVESSFNVTAMNDSISEFISAIPL